MRIEDRRAWVSEPGECVGCDGLVPKAEKVAGVLVHWCDLCWQRIVVPWERRARREHPESFVPEESA